MWQNFMNLVHIYHTVRNAAYILHKIHPHNSIIREEKINSQNRAKPIIAKQKSLRNSMGTSLFRHFPEEDSNFSLIYPIKSEHAH